MKFWNGMTKKTVLSVNDKLMIGDAITGDVQYIDIANIDPLNAALLANNAKDAANAAAQSANSAVLSAGYLGAIYAVAGAPTPGKSGYYEFSTAGTCTFITGGAVTVKIGDRLSVLFTAPSTYIYTKIAVDLSKTYMLANNTNLNTITGNGLYNGVSLVNAPTTDWMYLEVKAYSDGTNFIVQRATAFGYNTANLGLIWERTYNGSWSAWNKIYTSQNIIDAFKLYENAIQSILPFTNQRTSAFTIQGYINNTGVLTNDSGWRHTGYFDLSLMQNLVIKFTGHPAVNSVSFYDSSKVYISGVAGLNVTSLGTIPNNAKYVVFTGSNGENANEVLLFFTNNNTIQAFIESVFTKTTADLLYAKISDLPKNMVDYPVTLVNGYYSTDGSSTNDSNYKRCELLISDVGTAVSVSGKVGIAGGTQLALYLDSNNVVLGSEFFSNTGNIYIRQKLTIPINCAKIRLTALVSGGTTPVISVYKGVIATDILTKTSADLLYAKSSDLMDLYPNVTLIEDNSTNIIRYTNGYERRWFRNWINILTPKTISVVRVPIVRAYLSSKDFTDSVLVNVTTSTGISITKEISVDELNKNAGIDPNTIDISDLLFDIKLGTRISLLVGDKIQVTVYCKSANDKIQLNLIRWKITGEPVSEFYSGSNFYANDGNDALTDTQLSAWNSFTYNGYTGYIGVGDVSMATGKKTYSIILPERIYTVANNASPAKKELNYNQAAMIQLDHCFTGLMKEPNVRFKNNTDKLFFYSPAPVTSYVDTPNFNNGVNILKQIKSFKIEGDEIDDISFNVEHISTLNSATKAVKPRVLIIGDSITSGTQNISGATLPDDKRDGVYHLACRELFYKDWVDNGKVTGEYEVLFLGHTANTRQVTYNGETVTLKTYREGYPGMGTSELFSNADFSTGGNFSLNVWLSKYRTMDDNGVRLASNSPSKGTLVTDVNAWDVCTPTHVVFALGANDPINYDWLGNIKLAISRIHVELGAVKIGIAHTDSAGTFFPSLHPNLSDDMYYWNTDSEGRHTRLWKFAKDWLNDNTYDEDIDKVFYLPFMFTAPCDVAAHRDVVMPNGMKMHVPCGWGATTHVDANAHAHWGYQLYSWLKYTSI